MSKQTKQPVLEDVPKFPKFPKLPVELRLKIWKMCWQPVVAHFNGKGNVHINENLPILAVCREARHEILRNLIYMHIGTDSMYEDQQTLVEQNNMDYITWGRTSMPRFRVILNPSVEILALSFHILRLLPSISTQSHAPFAGDPCTLPACQRVRAILLSLTSPWQKEINWAALEAIFPNVSIIYVLYSNLVYHLSPPIIPHSVRVQDLEVDAPNKNTPLEAGIRLRHQSNKDRMKESLLEAQSKGVCKEVKMHFRLRR